MVLSVLTSPADVSTSCAWLRRTRRMRGPATGMSSASPGAWTAP